MRKITLIFFLLLSAISFAQFSANDVKYFVGTGNNTAYLVVDFKDGTDDRSYAWGIRFDDNNPITGVDALELLATEEPNFSYEQSNGFLDQIAFNAHDSYEMEYDFWSLWSSLDGNNWGMDGWMNSNLTNEMWYGASYGFGMAVPGPDAPAPPIPAYSSQWFSSNDITTWIGSGINESLIIIDLGTDTNGIANSFVFGIKYNGSITAENALELISNEFPSFSYTLQEQNIGGITLNNNSITNTPATTYKGTDLSNWVTQSDFLSTDLNNEEWLGLSFGSRRPFIPQDGIAYLGNENFKEIEYKVYPNPTSNYITIELDEEINEVLLYTTSGSQIMSSTSKELNITHLPNGVYLMKVATNTGIGFIKIIKK